MMFTDILMLIFVFIAVCMGVAVGVLVINKIGKVILRSAIKHRLNQQRGVEMRYLNQITGLLWEDLTSANVAGMFPVSLTDYFPLTGTKLDKIRKKNPDAFIAICARLAPLAMALKQAIEMRGGNKQIPQEVVGAIQGQMSQVQPPDLGQFNVQDKKPPLR